MAGILEVLGIMIPLYVWVGILLIIIGLLIASFIPVIGQKIGIMMVVLGLILSVGFSILKDLFSNPNFVAVVIVVVAIILILWILFPTKRK